MRIHNHLTHAAIAVLILLLCGCSSERSDATFAFATGGPAGLYYPMGGGMASLWSKRLDGVNVKAEVTGGSVTNVIQVSKGESEIGIAMADVVADAYAGTGRFSQSLDIRVLFAAYPNIVHILTLEGNGVKTISDLRGKRVALGAAGSGTSVAATNVIRGLGLTLDELAPVYLSFAETTNALKDGTIDVGFVVGGLGIAAVTELAVTRDLRLLSLDASEITRLNAQYPAYTGYDIPGATYAGVDEAVQAVGIWSVVVVNSQMPTEVAYRLACTIFLHGQVLTKVSPVARDMTVENVHRLASVPLHPGTTQFLDSKSSDCSWNDA